jgi:hypothetical protein
MTFAEYLKKVTETKNENSSWRMGQTYFNVLSDVRSDLSEQVLFTNLDPFFRDEVIGNFLAFVAENW